MGLFSHSITQVGTQVQRVVTDALVPDSVVTGVSKNLFDAESDGNQMVEYIMDELTNSIGLRAERMFSYGKEGYIWGNPQSSYHSSLDGKPATRAAIASMLKQEVDLTYYHFGPFNRLHAGWKNIVENYGYNPTSNELVTLSASKNTPVYLQDMQVMVKEATLAETVDGSLDVWGDAPNSGYTPNKVANATLGRLVKATPYMVDPAAPNDYIIVTYCWEETISKSIESTTINVKVVKTDTITIQLTGFDGDKDYHHARYTADGGKVGYFTYQMGAGQYPMIDSVFDTTFNGTGSFFPWTYFRFNKETTEGGKTSEEYKSSKKLLKAINMDFAAVTEGIEGNPDIKDVENAMMMYAVPAKTSNEVEQRYLFDFFDNIQSDTSSYSNVTKLPGTATFAGLLGIATNRTSIVIQDKRFKMALSYNGIAKEIIAGNIGKVGHHASGDGRPATTTTVPQIGGGTVTFPSGTSVHWYARQVTETVYEKITVINLQMKYWVYEGYTTTGGAENEEILMIPLDINITKTYSIPAKEELYARSLHFIFNSRVVTHLKWYQTGLFRVVMIIIAIVITILTEGSTWQAIGAAIAAGASAGTIIAMIVVAILQYLLVSMAMKLFVRVVGAKLAFVAAIVAAMYGVYDAFDAGGLEGAPWAKDLLQLSSGLSNAIQAKIQDEAGALGGDLVKFKDYMQDHEKTLEDHQKLLDNTAPLSPFIIFGESPNDFYQRTVHSGNIGMLGVESVSSFVEIALQLPKLSQTVGEPSYG